jgi:hypothetical protein
MPPVYFALIILQSIYPGWPQTVTVLILASQVAEITDMSCKHLALISFLMQGTP